MDTSRVPPKRRPALPWVGAAALVVVAGIAAWRWHAPAPEAMTPVPVQAGPLADTVPINAVLAPARVGVVSTISGGTVVEVVAFPGQAVKAGDILVKLSNPDLERQLGEAVSEHAGARADLVSQRADAVDQANSLKMAELNAANAVRIANMQLEAESKLQKQGIISRLTLDRTAAERDGKAAASEYASAHRIQARTASTAKVAAASERAEVLQARVDSLKVLVSGLTMRAPFDGVVSKVDGKPGASIAAGTQLAEVITPELQVNLEVAEQYANAIKVGQTIRLAGGVSGKVLALAPSAEGGIVKGKARLEGDTSKLRSDSTLPGEAVLAEHGTGIYIELEGGGLENKSVPATLQVGDKTVDRTVRFGPRYRQQLVVLDGAQPGEQIVALDMEAAR